MKKKKKLIIYIMIGFVLITNTLLLLTNNHKKEKVKDNNSINEKSNSEKQKSKKENNQKQESNVNTNSNQPDNNESNEITNSNQPDNNKSNDNNKKEQNNNSITSNNQNNNSQQQKTPSIDPAPIQTPPTPTYSCPENFSLNGTQCISIMNVNSTCPDNTVEYTGDYCINLSEGYENDSENCPNGHGILSIIGFGTPTIYKCYPLHNKINTCMNGYILDENRCINIINATVN